MVSQSGPEGLKLLEQIQYQFGGNIYEHLKAGQHKATKSAYKLYWNKQEAIKLIQQLLPYLILKKQCARDVLTYLTRD
jgi:transcriptional regulator